MSRAVRRVGVHAEACEDPSVECDVAMADTADILERGDLVLLAGALTAEPVGRCRAGVVSASR